MNWTQTMRKTIGSLLVLVALGGFSLAPASALEATGAVADVEEILLNAAPEILEDEAEAAHYPFWWPTTGRVSQGYGGGHYGIDIANGYGTNIYAAKGGTVTRKVTGCPYTGYYGSTCGGGYGNHVYVGHAYGCQTRYAHLGDIYVSLNQGVSKGQHVAEMASSGSSTGSHLHFEIRDNGYAQSIPGAAGEWKTARTDIPRHYEC